MDGFLGCDFRVVKCRCEKKLIPRLWLQTRWHLPHINASFSRYTYRCIFELKLSSIEMSVSFFHFSSPNVLPFQGAEGLSGVFVVVSVLILEHPVCLPSCMWWEQMQKRIPVVLLWLLTSPLPFLCTVLIFFFFERRGTFCFSRKVILTFFVIPFTAHRLLDSAQKKRERETERARKWDGQRQRGRRIEENRNRVEVTCSIFQLWTEQFPWHRSIKG